MKTICIYNRKGGIGKTTSVVNIGTVLEKDFNKRVLIVDCDSQCNTTDYLLEKENINFTLEDYLTDDVYDVHSIIYKTHFADAYNCSLNVIPASHSIDVYGEDNVYAVKELLEKLDSEYDYCLIDCTPYLAPSTLMAFCACRYIIAICEPETDSINGYSLLLDEIEQVKSQGYNDTLELLGMVFNKVVHIKQDALGHSIIDKFRKKDEPLDELIGEEVMDTVKDTTGSSDAVFKTTIRNAVIVKQARYFGIPVCYFKPRATICEEYRNLSEEILKKIGDK